MGQGWTWVIGSRKWHYFNNDTTSLCGKWWVPGMTGRDLEDSNDGSKDNCAACKRKVEKLREQENDNSSEGGVALFYVEGNCHD